MQRKLIQYEDKAALIIDQTILDSLKIDLNTSLEITTDGKNIIILPLFLEDRTTKLENSLKKINSKHGKTLQKLAE